MLLTLKRNYIWMSAVSLLSRCWPALEVAVVSRLGIGVLVRTIFDLWFDRDAR
jgi:hypothetical protein